MPIKVPDNLQAIEQLKKEHIFVMKNSRAFQQDIRPLKILLLNLMPNKVETEVQFIRLLANTPLQIELDLLAMETHDVKNTPKSHLDSFYKYFSDIKNQYYDGLIVTGAPVEHLDFTAVDYWQELTEIFSWSTKHIFASLFICWGAQAALNYFYQIPKYQLSEKKFGVFEHYVNKIVSSPIVNGLDDMIFIPHSRHTENKKQDIIKLQQLQIIIESDDAGIFAILDENKRRLFFTGHVEYDTYSLDQEYKRDISQNKTIQLPINYYQSNNINLLPSNCWRSTANILFNNWLNYFVYQDTPYELNKIAQI